MLMGTKDSFLEEFAGFWIHLLGQTFSHYGFVGAGLFPGTDVEGLLTCNRIMEKLFTNLILRWFKASQPTPRFLLPSPEVC